MTVNREFSTTRMNEGWGWGMEVLRKKDKIWKWYFRGVPTHYSFRFSSSTKITLTVVGTDLIIGDSKLTDYRNNKETINVKLQNGVSLNMVKDESVQGKRCKYEV